MDLHLDLDVKTKRLLRMALALLVVACSAVSDSRTKTMKPNAPPPCHASQDSLVTHACLPCLARLP